MESAMELKPCPFCGGPAERVNIDPTDEHEPNCGGSYIFCPSCLACSKVVFGEKIGLEEAWNMRTTHDRALEALDAAIRKECADRAVACFFSTMAESGLSTGNDYAVLVISDKLRAAIEGGQPKPLPVEVLAVASQDKLHIDIGTRKPVRDKKRGQP